MGSLTARFFGKGVPVDNLQQGQFFFTDAEVGLKLQNEEALLVSAGRGPLVCHIYDLGLRDVRLITGDLVFEPLWTSGCGASAASSQLRPGALALLPEGGLALAFARPSGICVVDLQTARRLQYWTLSHCFCTWRVMLSEGGGEVEILHVDTKAFEGER